ncbi:MAG: GNAT family N-acetyltransferase [Firmicutes bacterium]|nr:GNAT family N-acetyltransferase [Bacillota bacterium]
MGELLRKETGTALSDDVKKGTEMFIAETDLTEEVLVALIRLSEAWASENSCYGYRANVRSDIEGNRIFLARSESPNGPVIGYLFGHVERSEKATSIMPDGTPYFEVEELYVRPEHRSKGIGAKLFRYTEKAVAGEAEYMMLSTATKNWKAILHFYIDEVGMQFWSARMYKRVETPDEAE